MKIKTMLALIALTLAPTLVLAQGCEFDKSRMESASQCAIGQVWDSATSSCVTPANS